MLQATKTTPSVGTATLPKAASAVKPPKPAKKMPTTKSLSQEALNQDDRKKAMLLETKEERKRINDEKQRLAKLQREQLENQKREQAEKKLREAEEKQKKIQAERNERLKLEALKKKQLKEKQEKKYAEERKKEEIGSAQKDTSLYIRMQKQMIQEKIEAEKREQLKNSYHFDMLQTDDSTDDESKPADKRPPPPSWSSSKYNL
jgi:hypothetical protein